MHAAGTVFGADSNGEVLDMVSSNWKEDELAEEMAAVGFRIWFSFEFALLAGAGLGFAFEAGLEGANAGYGREAKGGRGCRGDGREGQARIWSWVYSGYALVAMMVFGLAFGAGLGIEDAGHVREQEDWFVQEMAARRALFQVTLRV